MFVRSLARIWRASSVRSVSIARFFCSDGDAPQELLRANKLINVARVHDAANQEPTPPQSRSGELPGALGRSSASRLGIFTAAPEEAMD